ncbi:type III restriction-modification system endonuclease, partial [bacterium]|nr:type III restriction-modification system endonuclease [bacterium]
MNYIVDFTEADFANRLVAEINAELPENQAVEISNEEMERVANLKGITPKALFIELLTKDFIDTDKVIISDRIDDFYQEYP